MSRGPDVAGLLSALAKYATSPEVRAAARRSRPVAVAAQQMAAGRRYRTRSLPGAKRYVNPAWHEQVRCERGHFVRAGVACSACSSWAESAPYDFRGVA